MLIGSAKSMIEIEDYNKRAKAIRIENSSHKKKLII
jgi:hypothetical protein